MTTRTFPPAHPRPTPSAPRPYQFPQFERRALSNGLRVVVAPIHTLPVVTTLAVVDAGATHDPPVLEGLSQLTARALVEGTSTMDALQLAERLELLGTTLDTGADWDSTIVQLTSLASRVDDAIAVLAEVLRAPAFPEAELERLRNERLADLAQLRAEPRGLADLYFSQLVYDGTSRFSRMAGGDEQSIMRITRDDVVEYHVRVFQPSRVTLIVVGDISVDAGVALVESRFGDWTGAAVELPAVIDKARYDDMRVHVVRKSDAPQSELRAGHITVPRVHPDYFPLVIMNAILGGLFSSRLNLNLREAHAYTYGAHSAFDWRRAASPFEISTAVETGVTANAVQEILSELVRIRESEVSEAELSLAVSYLDGVFPIRFETTAAVAGGLANLEIFRLPMDYFDGYRARVRAVTAQDVLRVAREHLDPARLQVVVVGDADAVVESLTSIGAGPVTVYEPTDTASTSESSSVS